jgi:hypothetical protein
MPWKNTTPMEEIIRFVSLAQTDRFTITELGQQKGSCFTFYLIDGVE